MTRPDDIDPAIWEAAERATAGEEGWIDSVKGREIIARAMMAVQRAERERAAQVCEAQAKAFLSPEYAYPQPMGSLSERFACDECAKAIRNHPTAPRNAE